MKQIQFIAFMLLGIMLASCSNDNFKIDGTIAGANGTMVKVMFQGDSSIVDEWVEVNRQGKFTFKGEAPQPVIVSLLNHKNEPLAILVATNGDHLHIQGDATRAMSLKVKGNRLNEEWQLFRDEHAAFYTDPNPSRLDAAIEKYVREHPKDMLSTVLLMADYSNHGDRKQVDEMLKSIDPDAKPASLTTAYLGNPLGRKNVSVPRLMTLTLAKQKGVFEEVSLTDRVTLIYLWANPQNDRKSVTQWLGGIKEKVRVLDILAESDTLHWHHTIEGEDWAHYWAPGGPLEPGIQLLGINMMPWFAVVDSTGLVTYSGPRLNEAVRNAEQLIGNP